MSHKGENFSVEGDFQHDLRNDVVSGEISSPEAKANEKEMLRRDEIMQSLEDLQKKHGDKEEIVHAFENASPLTSPTERLEATIDNLNELSKQLDKEASIFNLSKRRRISTVINKLRELL